MAPEAGAAPAQAVWTGASAAPEETASGTEVYLPLPAAGAAARLAAPRVARAVAPLDPAAVGDLPVMVVPAALEVEAAGAGDGGK